MMERSYNNLELFEIAPILCKLFNCDYVKFKLIIDNQHCNCYGKKHYRLKNGFYLHSISEVIEMIKEFATKEATITIKIYNLINTKCLAKISIYNE